MMLRREHFAHEKAAGDPLRFDTHRRETRITGCLIEREAQNIRVRLLQSPPNIREPRGIGALRRMILPERLRRIFLARLLEVAANVEAVITEGFSAVPQQLLVVANP